MPRLRATGGIFWRNTNGIVTGYDALGNIIAMMANGVLSGTVLKSGVSAQFTTASTTDVSSGIGVAITPVLSGNVEISLQFTMFISAGTGGCTYKVFRTTGAIPSAGSAVVGSAVAGSNPGRYSNAFSAIFISAILIDDTAVINTAYNYYLSCAADASTTAGVSPVHNLMRLKEA